MFLQFKTAAIGKLALLVVALLVFSINGNAAGALDPTFGANGRVVTTVGFEARATAVAIQPDGKIVVAGDVKRDNTQRDIVLVRYNTNGTLDSGFGENGRIILSVSNGNDIINAMTLDSSGRIIVVGSTQPSPEISITDFLTLRFTANGALDPTFGNNGVAVFSQGSDDSFNAVVVQPSGRIVAGGATSDGGQAALIGITPQGALDRSFADFGFYLFNFPSMIDERVLAIVLRPNGRMLIGGRGKPWGAMGVAPNFLAELEANGDLVEAFGNQGVRNYSSGHTAYDLSYDLTLLPDGRIATISDRLFLFSSNGTYESDNYPEGGAIAVRSDGKIVVTGQIETSVLKGNGRRIGTALNLLGLIGKDIAVQGDDKIIIISSSEAQFSVLRLVGITSQGTKLADYDRDEKTDIAVLRPSNSTVYAIGSNIGVLTYQSGEASFEIKRVLPETDGCHLPFFYWKSGNITGSQAFFVRTNGTARQQTQWGLLGDIPVGGDYDFDTCVDMTVYRPSEGIWYILQSGNNQLNAVRWGLSEDKPVPADYDYDGITDIAVYRPSNGTWYVRRSSDGNMTAVRWGNASDIPLTGDFDGDGRADFVVYRPSEQTWYLLQTTAGFRAERFGLENDFPAPGDYDGDGRHDIAVFRRGVWYILGSTRGFYGVPWGLSEDEPVAVRYDH